MESTVINFIEEVMEWMFDIQLGRRNLSPIQRIAVAEKYRPIYEKQAKENQSKAGKEYGNGGTKLTANLPQALDKEKKERNPTTDKKLSDIAGVSEKTYRRVHDRAITLAAFMKGASVELRTLGQRKHPFALENIKKY